MTRGPLANHLTTSFVIAHEHYQFTAHDIITYHAYQLGEVHLSPKDKRRVRAYEDIVSALKAPPTLRFASNGPASLALKGFLNRVTRSDVFRHMFESLKGRALIPDDVIYPDIAENGLRHPSKEDQDAGSLVSLKWTERAAAEGLVEWFEQRCGHHTPDTTGHAN
jgi:hypothetical protein